MTKQQDISRILILGVCLMAYVYYICTPGEHEKYVQSASICPLITVIFAGYAITYKGKDRLVGIILLLIFLALSVFGVFLYLLAGGFGKQQ